MRGKMKPTWQAPIACFVLFNLLAAPLIGRGA